MSKRIFFQTNYQFWEEKIFLIGETSDQNEERVFKIIRFLVSNLSDV